MQLFGVRIRFELSLEQGLCGGGALDHGWMTNVDLKLLSKFA
jgi:hypothetical protein